LELVLLMVLLGIVTGIAVPSFRHGADRAAVRSARQELLRALDAARGAAIRRGRAVEVDHRDPQWTVFDPTDSASLWLAPGPGQLGVTLTGFTTPLTFGASGLATGAANRTLQLQRGNATATLVLSRLGRIR
jgi:Tfp pilus assembly protein FimT